MDGSNTTSSLKLVPTAKDHDAELICSAVNPLLAAGNGSEASSSGVETRRKLIVHCKKFSSSFFFLFFFFLLFSPRRRLFNFVAHSSKGARRLCTWKTNAKCRKGTANIWVTHDGIESGGKENKRLIRWGATTGMNDWQPAVIRLRRDS